MENQPPANMPALIPNENHVNYDRESDTDQDTRADSPKQALETDPLTGVDLTTRNGGRIENRMNDTQGSEDRLGGEKLENKASPEDRPRIGADLPLPLSVGLRTTGLLNLKQEPGEEEEEKPKIKVIKGEDGKPVSVRSKKPWYFMETEIEGCPVVFKRSPFPDDRKKMKKNIIEEGNFKCGGCKKSLPKKKICVTVEIEESDTENETEDEDSKAVEVARVNLVCGKVCHLCHRHFKLRYELQKHLIDDHNMQEMVQKLHKRDWQKCLSKEEIEKLEDIRLEEDKQEKVCERLGCHQLIVGKKAFMTHIYTVHKGEKKVFECSICQKTFKKKVFLNKHKFIHTGNYPFMCSECGKQFNDKSNMQQHMKIHERKLNPDTVHNTLTKIIMHSTNPQDLLVSQDPNSLHVCDQCGKSFYNLAGLKVHSKVHDKTPKIYQCKECPETFTNSTDFKWHKQGHLGHTQYSCEECGKKCPNKSYYEEHMNKHTGARPFTCNECGKGFKQKSTLVGHYKKLHTKLPTLNPRFDKPKNLACPYCEEMFTSRIPMGKHVSRAHPEVYPSYTKMLRALNKGEIPRA